MIRRILSPSILSNSKRLLSVNPEPVLNVPPTNLSQLTNGFRVISEDWGTKTSTVGVWINTGSRYENWETNGVAHFLEHMSFKGTGKRTTASLELEIETKGALLNAYTAREMTAFYFKCLNEDIEWTLELLSDILRRSNYDKRDIERERAVILREMQDIESNHQESVFDYMHLSAFPKCSLGWTILGPEQNINRINRQNIIDFVADQYKPHRMAVIGVGGIDHERLIEFTDKYFGDMPASNPLTQSASAQVKTPAIYRGTMHKQVDNRNPQAHVAIACAGPGHLSGDTLALMIACSVTGQWNRNFTSISNNLLASKCFDSQTIHSFQSFFTCYHDVSLWGIYLISEGKGLDKMTNYVLEEWNRLCSFISDEEVERAKNSLKAHLLTLLDGTTPVCEEIGRHMISYDRRVHPQEMVMRIDNVTAEQVRKVCTQFIMGQDPAVVGLGPVNDLPEYEYIRRQLK